MSVKYNSNIIKKVKLKNGMMLTLREAEEDDAEKVIDYLNIVGGESDNLLFGVGEFKATVEQERKYIESIKNDVNSLMLLGVIDNKIVSVSQISSLNRKRIAHNSEIAISVIKECWKIGIGNVVMEQLIKFAKDNINIKNINLGVRADNYNAIRLYEKCGFKKSGTHKNFFYVKGKYYDEILMDLYI